MTLIINDHYVSHNDYYWAKPEITFVHGKAMVIHSLVIVIVAFIFLHFDHNHFVK